MQPSRTSPRPLVGVVASVVDLANGRFAGHVTGAKNVEALERFSDCVPIIVPALRERLDIDEFVHRIDGLLLTGGRANVEPHHFNGEPFPEDEVVDPDRDYTALPLVRACVEHEVPIFGICRGIQEMNVALGGTLHYRLHLLDGVDDHRMPQYEAPPPEEVFRLRHELRLTPGGLFDELADGKPVRVNSLHGQGIDQVASRFVVEALAEDGVIEGIRLRDDPTFTVGVQWHAEWQPETHAFGRALFERFGEAARACAARRWVDRMSIAAD